MNFTPMQTNSHQKVILTENLERDLTMAMTECEHDRVFILTDSNTRNCCLPAISHFLCLRNAHMITMPATDTHKNLDTLSSVWTELQQHNATRHSLLICLGGGVVTDLGGFAASTFKRGINFINIPTTLLGMVDAAVGGKTGVNFGGLKNEIGVFSEARYVMLCADFLSTLDSENLRSGYAEMLKHALISTTSEWAELLNFDLDAPDYTALGQMAARSVKVKERIVAQDPHERGIRKALNLGHTIGHAIESLLLQRSPVLHGYAVAYGLVAELYLSAIRTGFPTDKLRQTFHYVRQYYGVPAITCDDYPQLIEMMHHDKKNTGNDINVTLLGDIGDIRINQVAAEQEISEALDFLREG